DVRRADAAPATAPGHPSPGALGRAAVVGAVRDRPGRTAVLMAWVAPRCEPSRHAKGFPVPIRRPARIAQAGRVPPSPHRRPGLALREPPLPATHRGGIVA